MMQKLRDKLINKDREAGDSELVVTLFTIPILAFLLFTIINVSSYFQVRSEVQDAARDGARLVALYGGTTSTAYLNTTGKTVPAIIQARLYKNGKCTFSYCKSAPTVTCSVISASGASSTRATAAGQTATCTISYAYGAVAPISFGFQNLFAYPIKVSGTTVTETGYR